MDGWNHHILDFKDLRTHLVQPLNFIGVETDIILFINSTCLLNSIMHEALKGYAESKTQFACLIACWSGHISVGLIGGIRQGKESKIDPFHLKVLNGNIDVV